MKKKILGTIVVAIAVNTMINVNLNKVSTKGDLAMANVEAFAQSNNETSSTPSQPTDSVRSTLGSKWVETSASTTTSTGGGTNTTNTSTTTGGSNTTTPTTTTGGGGLSVPVLEGVAAVTIGGNVTLGSTSNTTNASQTTGGSTTTGGTTTTTTAGTKTCNNVPCCNKGGSSNDCIAVTHYPWCDDVK